VNIRSLSVLNRLFGIGDKEKSMRIVLLSVAALAVFSAPAVLAADDDQPNWIMDTSGIGQDVNGVVQSNQILELGSPTSSAMQLEGESAMRLGDIDRAITALQKAVEMSPMDMDKRILYAEALEKKLVSQKPRDPKLYNFLLKQWLFIAKKAEFIDQSLQGRAHLTHLCGTAPKAWERTDKFLARVLIPEDSSEIALGKSKTDKSEKDGL
jgi:hypothetical protein